MILCMHTHTQIIYIACMYIKCKINVIAFLISTTPLSNNHQETLICMSLKEVLCWVKIAPVFCLFGCLLAVCLLDWSIKGSEEHL